jgi:hypothetical protein
MRSTEESLPRMLALIDEEDLMLDFPNYVGQMAFLWYGSFSSSLYASARPGTG